MSVNVDDDVEIRPTSDDDTDIRQRRRSSLRANEENAPQTNNLRHTARNFFAE